jgi:hypothetical protein
VSCKLLLVQAEPSQGPVLVVSAVNAGLALWRRQPLPTACERLIMLLSFLHAII